MTPEQLTDLVEIAFNLGVDYGRRAERRYIQANLENAIGLDSDMVVAAAHGGAGLMQSKKDKQLDYQGIAFANSKPETVEEYFNLLKNRNKYTDILHTIATELNKQ
jgi:biotin synthase-like enzyme